MNDSTIQSEVDEIYRINDLKPMYYEYVKTGGKLGFEDWVKIHDINNRQEKMRQDEREQTYDECEECGEERCEDCGICDECDGCEC